MPTTVLPAEGVLQVRLLCPETKRWRTYEVDAALDLTLVQHLNDLAFAHGAEVVSLCAGHEVRDPGGEAGVAIDGERAFAEARFAIFFPSRQRLAAQQARVCIEVLARACAGPDTVVETFHELDIDRGSGKRQGFHLGRSLVAVRHTRPTAEAPAMALAWWRGLVDRLDSNKL